MQNTQIPVLELRRLLYELKDLRPDICVRFRLLGEMWQNNFSRVIKMTETGTVLFNESKNEAVSIKDLREVVQFEIDSAFQGYHPHDHYSVEPTMNVTERYINTSRT